MPLPKAPTVLGDLLEDYDAQSADFTLTPHDAPQEATGKKTKKSRRKATSDASLSVASSTPTLGLEEPPFALTEPPAEPVIRAAEKVSATPTKRRKTTVSATQTKAAATTNARTSAPAPATSPEPKGEPVKAASTKASKKKTKAVATPAPKKAPEAASAVAPTATEATPVEASALATERAEEKAIDDLLLPLRGASSRITRHHNVGDGLKLFVLDTNVLMHGWQEAISL